MRGSGRALISGGGEAFVLKRREMSLSERGRSRDHFTHRYNLTDFTLRTLFIDKTPYLADTHKITFRAASHRSGGVYIKLMSALHADVRGVHLSAERYLVTGVIGILLLT